MSNLPNLFVDTCYVSQPERDTIATKVAFEANQTKTKELVWGSIPCKTNNSGAEERMFRFIEACTRL